MSIRDEVFQLIRQATALAVPITEKTHLYQDLHLDSISYISLLLALEDRFGITIEIPEMEQCLVVGRMLELVEEKTGEVPL